MTRRWLRMRNLKNLINKSLDRYLPSEKEDPGEIHKAMRYSVFSGGKRMRPILAIESCMACGGDIKKVLPAAAAIELIHTYSLIHDDLPAMDDDDYRRGKPASHKVFGEANAILAGDALLTLAFNIIATESKPEFAAKAVKELSDAIGTKGMLGGQVVDLNYKDKKKDKKQLNHINLLKTAKLFEVSTKLGAMAASSDKRRIEAMAKFGASLGMAFQIIDDIMDEGDYIRLFGHREAHGHSKDLIEDAKAGLKIFGRRADRLKNIADHLLNRA